MSQIRCSVYPEQTIAEAGLFASRFSLMNKKGIGDSIGKQPRGYLAISRRSAKPRAGERESRRAHASIFERKLKRVN